MDNPVKGERSFEARGKTWTMKFGFNAMCAIEERYDRPFLQVVARVFPQLSTEDLLDEAKVREAAMRVRMADLRAILTAALDEKHGLSEREVGELIDAVGVKQATALVAEAVRLAVVEGGDDAPANPPKRTAKKAAEPTG